MMDRIGHPENTFGIDLDRLRPLERGIARIRSAEYYGRPELFGDNAIPVDLAAWTPAAVTALLGTALLLHLEDG